MGHNIGVTIKPSSTYLFPLLSPPIHLKASFLLWKSTTSRASFQKIFHNKALLDVQYHIYELLREMVLQFPYNFVPLALTILG